MCARIAESGWGSLYILVWNVICTDSQRTHIEKYTGWVKEATNLIKLIHKQQAASPLDNLPFSRFENTALHKSHKHHFIVILLRVQE